jgi:hypothetical protein
MKVRLLVKIGLNPLSAMGDFRHLIIVSFQVFGKERVHWNLDFLGEMQQ